MTRLAKFLILGPRVRVTPGAFRFRIFSAFSFARQNSENCQNPPKTTPAANFYLENISIRAANTGPPILGHEKTFTFLIGCKSILPGYCQVKTAEKHSTETRRLQRPGRNGNALPV